jgi:hypothetical protein
MYRFRLIVQAVVLAIGAVFSCYTLIDDYRRFFSAGGSVFELSGCAVANPVLTPCFYGALAFLIAFVWALMQLQLAPEAMARRQRRLNGLLAAGTVFAWGNFAYELYLYSTQRSSAFSCPPPGEVAAHPTMMPCYYGAWIFFVALAISRMILRAHRTAYEGRNGHV